MKLRRVAVKLFEEGFELLVNPASVEGNERGEVTGVRCVRMELGEPDASGRRRPRPVAGSEFVLPADLVLIAYGFDPVPFPAESDLSKIELNEWGAIRVDDSQRTNLPGVFAGGDVVRDPSLWSTPCATAARRRRRFTGHCGRKAGIPTTKNTRSSMSQY